MPFILGTNSIKDTGYNVDNSLRFNKASGDYLNRAQGTPTSRRTFTYSGWIKISELNTYDILHADNLIIVEGAVSKLEERLN